MEFIDEKFRLHFVTAFGYEIIINDKFLEQIRKLDNSSLPENTKIIQYIGPFFELSFSDESKIIIYYFPVKCKININQSKEEILLYSLQHLKLILTQLKEEYQNPYFYSNYFKKEILINEGKLKEKEFSYEREIEIKDKKIEENTEEIKLIFKILKTIYENKNNFTYEFISPNFNIYYKNFPIILTDQFNYIYSDNRKTIESEFRLFLKNDSEMLFPICGPKNIGKTITSLWIQKLYYLKGIKSLYLNLKFYFKEPFKDLELKINTLIKECFYFIENEEQLLYLSCQFQTVNIINDVFQILYKFILSKNFSKQQFFLIIDEYQQKYDSINILDICSGFKIFLLSPINDKGVQENLISAYHEEALKQLKVIEEKNLKKIIRYKYYESLFDFRIYNSMIFENKIKDKIKEIEAQELEEIKLKEKFEFISFILNQFNFIPKYVSKFIYEYYSIYDFLFYECNKLFLKLMNYESDKIIDRSKINELLKDKNIMQRNEIGNPDYKALSKDQYIGFIKYIPFNYINYYLNNNGKFYFYYSFPIFKDILNEYNEYFKSKDIFYNDNANGSKKGIAFEKIVITRFKIFNSLNIEGHLEVNSIVDMDFTPNFKLLDKEYIKSKKNILITQKNKQGEDYDFAIYKPEKKKLILFQAKYQIENNLIRNKDSYIESSKNVLNKFRKTFDDNSIENVYLLYISSEEYNIKKKQTLINILTKKQINCLFYSVTKRDFSFNFEDKIDDIECTDSFLLLPELKNYKEQGIKSERNKQKKNDILEGEITFLNKKIKKNYDTNKIYESLKNHFYIKKIGFTLGQLIKIESFLDEEIKMNKNKEYVIIFSLKDDDDSSVDFKKPIGLMYYEGEKEIFLEVTENKIFYKYEELFKQFSGYCHYGIGEKV